MHRNNTSSNPMMTRTKSTHNGYSEVTLSGDLCSITFFTKKGKDRRQQNTSGYFADVSPAYESISSLAKNQPFLSIKKMKIEGGELQLQTAMKEVDCHKAIGRNAYLFRGKNRLCIAYDWQPGVTLYSLMANQTKISDQTIIKWMESLLKAIVLLHENNIAHNDISLVNIIVNLTADTVALIDFGSAMVNERAAAFFRNDLYSVLLILNNFTDRRHQLKSTSDALPFFQQTLTENISRWDSKQAYNVIKRMGTVNSM